MAAKIRIPKRVGAVKLPRKVRKKAKKAIRAATSPLVRDIATAAMAAAGAARGGGGSRADEAGEFSVRIDGSKVADAFRKAAADGLRAFMEGLEEGLKEARVDEPAEPPAPPTPPEPPVPPKPRSRRPDAAKPGRRAP